METEHYRYCLRCNPSPGDYNCYCTAYDLDVQRQNMARDKPLVGRVSYANGDAQEFTCLLYTSKRFHFKSMVMIALLSVLPIYTPLLHRYLWLICGMD